MPNIDITKPELIWPGKYDENGNRVENRDTALPFQVTETNPSMFFCSMSIRNR